ncbi:MAG: hypothetical protein RLW62_16595 [Gammaproteobacteria bacterium]
MATSAVADGPSAQFSAAGAHSSAASTHAATGAVNLVGAVAAVPLAAVAGAGEAVGALAAAARDSAGAPAMVPLPVDDAIYTAAPRPDVALGARQTERPQ